MGYIFYFSLGLFLLLCLILCLSILVQESKSLGLGASFGGDPGESFFGTSTAEVLKKFTAWLGVAFLALCILLSIASESISKTEKKSIPYTIEEEIGS
jgi:preprotein translocase subunit SecG